MSEFCYACAGEHEADPPDAWVEFRGRRFSSPFLCMCCGREICARQWAFGRCCGTCDVGACESGNRAFLMRAAHEHPPWWNYNPQERWEGFLKATHSVPIEAEARSA